MSKMNWGKGMAIAMVAFMAFIITMAILMSKVDTNLVEKDYYEKGQNFNAVAQMKANFKERDSLLHIQKTEDYIVVNFTETPDSGLVHYFRPSDRNADIKLRFTEKNTIPIERQKLLPGIWKIRILFYLDGKAYLTEEPLSN